MSTKRTHSSSESDGSESDSEQRVKPGIYIESLTVNKSYLEINPAKNTDSRESATDSLEESESSDDEVGDQDPQYNLNVDHFSSSNSDLSYDTADEAVEECMDMIRVDCQDFNKEAWVKFIDFVFKTMPPESLRDFLMRDPLDFKGLSRDQLSAIPIFEYRDQQLDSEVCSLCNNRFNVGDFLRKLSCDHVYHTDCSYEVLRKISQCPTCKISLLPNENQDQNP